MSKMLRLRTMGVKGGAPQKKFVGFICASIEDQFEITVDDYSGVGPDYKKRETPLINICDENKTCFNGTFEELKHRLETYKRLQSAIGLVKEKKELGPLHEALINLLNSINEGTD